MLLTVNLRDIDLARYKLRKQRVRDIVELLSFGMTPLRNLRAYMEMTAMLPLLQTRLMQIVV